jgi:hypothetical protein
MIASSIVWDERITCQVREEERLKRLPNERNEVGSVKVYKTENQGEKEPEFITSPSYPQSWWTRP